MGGGECAFGNFTTDRLCADTEWIRGGLNMGYRERILEEYEGKTLWFCEISGTNGQRINLDPYAITFCHEHEIARPSELTISDVKSFSIDKYYQAVYQLLREMQKDNYPCRKCSNCKKKKFTLYTISGLVTIST